MSDAIRQASRAVHFMSLILTERAVLDAARAVVADGVTRYVWTPAMPDISSGGISIKVETTLEPPEEWQATRWRRVDADAARACMRWVDGVRDE